jgi:hypothetical protein
MQDGTLRVRQLQLQSSPHTLLPYPHSSLSADCSVQVYLAFPYQLIIVYRYSFSYQLNVLTGIPLPPLAADCCVQVYLTLLYQLICCVQVYITFPYQLIVVYRYP